jgi:hypothetical protein
LVTTWATSCGSEALQGGGWKATVVVSVHDTGHALVAGATVSGGWSGGFNGSGSCTLRMQCG